MKTSLKVAVATVGLVSNISYNAGDDVQFLEDDSLFAQTSSQQASGWSWGFSKANATCRGTYSCSIDQSNGDDYAREEYEEARWRAYDQCMASAQTAQAIAECEEIVEGL